MDTMACFTQYGHQTCWFAGKMLCSFPWFVRMFFIIPFSNGACVVHSEQETKSIGLPDLYVPKFCRGPCKITL